MATLENGPRGESRWKADRAVAERPLRSDMTDERTGLQLPGGHRSSPIRRGNTVRKPSGSWTRSSYELLAFLHEQGYGAAPRPLGVGAEGDEVLSWVEGTAASGAPLPEYVWSLDSLVAVTQLVRHLHDLTRGWRPQTSDWKTAPGAPPGDVICHNDAGPWNVVFRERRPVALVDWDVAAPGTRLWDIGYLAWHWIPLWPDDRAADHGFQDLDRRGQRVRGMVDAYGMGISPDGVLDAARARQQSWLQQLVDGARAGIEAYVHLLEAGSEQGVHADLRFLDENRTKLLAATEG